MIVTLTPNPSLDLLFSAERLAWDDANRLPMPRRRAGGQGINVVRAVRALRPGGAARAIAPLGGPVGRELREMLDAEGTALTVVPIDGPTRVFVGVREASSDRSLLLNPRGPEVDARTGDALLDAVDRTLDEGADWLICCGSLLPGLADGFYAEVGRRARRRGVRFIPDCDGPALAAAAGSADLLVPNEAEVGRLVGRPVRGEADAVRAGRELVDAGVPTVVVTMEERGAVRVERDGAWWACPRLPDDLSRSLDGGSAVGAGDAFLAALLLEWEAAPGEALAAAVAAGTATLLSRGPDLVLAADVRRIRPHVETRLLS